MKNKIELLSLVIILFIATIMISVNAKVSHGGKVNLSGYTVEFTYNNKEYVMNGDSEVKLSDILDYLEIHGSIEEWEVSNSDLFDIYLGKEDGIVYKSNTPTNKGTIPWLLAKKAFDTTEWLKVKVNGKNYKIIVTDDNTTQNVPAGNYSGTGISTNLDGHPSTGKWDTHPDGTYDEYINNASTPDNVKQSQSTTSATDFAAGLPISTIFIDISKIGNSEKKTTHGNFTLLTENENIRGGFVFAPSDTDGDLVSYNPFGQKVNKDDEPIEGSLMQLEPNKINVLEGDLFQFIYEDAAILPNGEMANLKIVYSNAKIAIDYRLGLSTADLDRLRIPHAGFTLEPSNYQGMVNLVKGGSATRGGTDKRFLGTTTDKNGNIQLGGMSDGGWSLNQLKAMAQALNKTIQNNWGATGQTFPTANSTVGNTPALGQSIDIKYQVVDDSGNPVNGTFIFAVTGINLDRDPYRVTNNNAAKPVWPYTENDANLHFFSESMSINSGLLSDYIYVRPNSDVYETDALAQSGANRPNSYRYFYPHVIEDENGNPKFIGNAYNSSSTEQWCGEDQSYNSGFVLLANAMEGITVTSTGHGSGTSAMNTQAYGGKQIWHRYTSSTGKGGNIQTTTEGNYGGTLNDKSDKGVKSSVLDQGVYVVPEGKTVIYTMTPDSKYRIKKLEIKDSNGNIKEIKYNDDELYKMPIAETVSVTDAAGNTATLIAKSNGVFTLEIPYAESEEDIHVEWEKYMGDLTIKKETTSDINGTFDFRIKAWKTDDTTALLDLTDLFDHPDSQGYYAFTLHNNENVEIQIPYGYSYEVYENTQVGWRLKNINGDEEKTKATGSIVSSNDDITETFLNELVTFDLTIKKMVTGNIGDLDKEFDFTVKIINRENTAINGTYKIVKNGIEQTVDISNNGYAFKLKHNETFVIKDIEERYSYEITETDTEYIEQYKIIKTDDDSVITAQQSGLKANGTLLNNQTVEFVNNKEKAPDPENIPTTIEGDVPQTGDKITSYIIMLILSVIGLISSIIYMKRNNLVNNKE